jgi:hypothetical protein
MSHTAANKQHDYISGGFQQQKMMDAWKGEIFLVDGCERLVPSQISTLPTCQPDMLFAGESSLLSTQSPGRKSAKVFRGKSRKGCPRP